MKTICIINGPNLNMLGKRPSAVYGSMTHDEIKSHTEECLLALGYKVHLDWFQSNGEGEIVDRIQALCLNPKEVDGLIINPGGYSHTSVAILDALEILNLPIIEVHISNIYKREEFRQTLLTAKASTGIISGLGKDSYLLAAISILKNKDWPCIKQPISAKV